MKKSDDADLISALGDIDLQTQIARCESSERRAWSGLGQRGTVKLDGNVWRLIYRLPPDTNQRRRKKSIALGTRIELRDKHAARAAGDRAMARLMPRQLPSGASPPWREWCDRYVDIYVLRLRTGTMNGNSSIVARHLRDAFGECRLHEIDTSHIQTFLDDQNRAGAKPSTIRTRFNVLRRMLRCAVAEGLAAASPISAALSFGRDARVLKTAEDRAFTESELERIMLAAKEPLLTICKLGLLAGLRPAEALALQWHHIHLDDARIDVKQQASRRVITTPKTASSAAAVHIPHELIEHLRAYRQMWKWNEAAFLFPGNDGQPLCSSGIRKHHLAPLLASLGIVGRSLHGFRHSFGMRLGGTGASLATLKACMRQTSLKAVEVYVSVRSEDVARATEQAALIISQGQLATSIGR